MGAFHRNGARACASLALAFALATSFAACGSGAQKRQAQALEGADILSSTAPLGERLVTQAEIERASDTAAEQTFLRLWSLLQYQSWDQAAEQFEPGLRNEIGDALLTGALSSDVIVWQATKPHVVSAHTTSEGAVVQFLARSEVGAVVPASISFERAGSEWLVSYFSLLNPALQRVAQARAQAQIEPLATRPSREAAAQGDNALYLQGAYRESVQRARRAAAHSGASTSAGAKP
jgi:uncharacterized lipoprotein YmbA